MQQLVKISSAKSLGVGQRPALRKRPSWWHRHRLEVLALPGGIILLIGLWALVVAAGDYPAFILPGPTIVFSELIEITLNGTLWQHAQATLLEIVGGLALGLSTATLLGYLLAKSPLLERVAGPYIVASQSIPAVAIAPLLVIWLGSGKLSKILICALVVFFPVLVNTIVGIRSVDQGLKVLMRSLRANRWQTFIILEIPAALPVLLGGLKIGVTLSVIGAVVGEFVGADRGLGYLISLAKGLFDTPLMFAALIVLGLISLTLYLIVTGLERWLLAWQR
ncbi:MAG TPA: ABC transporter permease [Anaerolineae bacterium]|nr:ABC transporter permease [Anaerolineae bacterium]HMR64277.1 ABC transporter permease [Anaerolineae bacterium]